jgi:hypothetical protein
MAFHHFKHMRLEPIYFVLLQYNCSELLYKDLYSYDSITSQSNYMRLCIQLQYGPGDMRCELFVYFFIFHVLVQNYLVTSK